MMEDTSRRDFIRMGGASALTLGSAGIAGCTSSIPGVGDDYEGAAIGNWLIAPSLVDVFDEDTLEEEEGEEAELESAELQGRGFGYVVPDAIFDHETELGGYDVLGQSNIRSRTDRPATEIDWELFQTVRGEYEVYSEEGFGENVSTEPAWASVSVIAGSFEPADIEDALEEWIDDEYSRDSLNLGDDADEPSLGSAGSHQEFDLYEVDERDAEPFINVDDWAVAVRDDYVIEVSVGSFVDAMAVLEAAIDGRIDGDDRWSDEDDGEALLNYVESGQIVNGSTFPVRTVDAAIERERDVDPDDLDEDAIPFKAGQETSVTPGQDEDAESGNGDEEDEDDEDEKGEGFLGRLF